MTLTPRTLALAIALTMVLPLLPAAADTDDDRLRATVRITSYGIPHILADDHASAGFGYGYVFASDNICVIADSYVTVNAERSRHFGPDDTYVLGGNGTTNTNLDSDFFFQRIIDRGIVEDLVAQEPPLGPLPEIREAIRGYVAGYNHYLREIGGADGISDPQCAGEEWVREIDEMDVYRRFYQLILLASQGIAIDEIGGAQPPPPGDLSAGEPTIGEDDLTELEHRFDDMRGIGSNAYAIGRDLTDNGRGLLLGNPHFPWSGSERFYQAHVTIPGVMDAAGASLFGVPIVLIGHNADVAWSHTVSTAFRFTPFQLTLAGDPTRYVTDEGVREMERDEVTVTVKRDDGGLGEETRTLYWTEYGPVLTGILGLPIFPWTHATAFAMGDANADNFRILNHFYEKNLADSVGTIDRILRHYLGIPWVNTIATDRHGDAYYADISVVPHVTDEHAQECSTAMGQVTFAALGLPILDGARTACGWGSDADAPIEGIFGAGNLPTLSRDDYTANMNDSYWLTNPREPITGYDRIIGDEETERTLRTRIGLTNLEDRLTSDGELEPFTTETVTDIAFDNRQYAAELAYEGDALVGMCEQMESLDLLGSGDEDPCEALARWASEWDLRDDIDAEGALLFRRFWTHASGAVPSPWREPFDPGDPVDTPRDLNTEHPGVRHALRQAVSDLQNAGIPLDAPLGAHQYVERGGERIALHGGPGTLGLFNAMNFQWAPDEGYTHIPHGTSYVQVVHFQEGPCPDVRTILTYSQSSDPTSPHHTDQTHLYADKEWVEVPFCEEDILADPNLRIIEVEEEPPPGRRSESRRPSGVPTPPSPPRS
jgi:acyl-homoserine-lactone acylase